MKINFKQVIVLLLLMSASLTIVSAQYTDKNRLIVLTDIEADPDDSQTLVRLLVYANQIDIEGLIATTSTHQRTRVAPETIRRILDGYGNIQANLLKHEAGFPTEQQLLATVKQGLPVYGMEGVGQGKDSEGSEWIIKALEKNDNRPLWISVWGGPNTLAQALWKIKETKSQAEAKKMIAKLRVYTISDQDDSGVWMRKNFPDLWYIVSPGGNYGTATWRAMNMVTPGANNDVVSNPWIAENIQQDHGPLGALYPDVSYSMEGDTPSWLMLIINGLNNPDHPEWGSWGGRYELYTPAPPAQTATAPPAQAAPARPAQAAPATTAQAATAAQALPRRMPDEPETRPIWTNASDKFTPSIPNKNGKAIRQDTVKYNSNHVTLWRWREDFQNDFAARMDWCVETYENANHPPVAIVNQPEAFTVKSGENFKLDADGSYDPDGDNLSYWWFQYPEAGTYKELVSFGSLSENLYNVHTIKAPEVTSPQTVHFILKVTDKGTPALSRYKRVIVTIVPK